MKLVMTGGHHSSALPVIKKLRELEPEIKIFWFGHKHTLKGDCSETLEYKEIRELNIPFYELKAGKLYRTLDLIRLLKVPFGLFHALFLLIKLKPDLIVSFGGYLAAPTVVAGSFLRIPSITHEQTVTAGYSNRLISFFAERILVSWPQSLKYYPQEKTVLSGIPLREEIFERHEANLSLNNELPVVYITAGKTGSHKINLAVEEVLETLLSKFNLIHQTGSHSKFNDLERLSEKYQKLVPVPKGNYVIRDFTLSDEIGDVYAAADLVVSRAGAHTVAEIMALEKPALLIPIPWVSHNEQMENAKMVVESGLGVILEEKDLSGNNLLAGIEKILSSPSRYTLTDKSLKLAFDTDPSTSIAEEVLRFKK